MRCGRSTGSHRRKKVARMVAIIRQHFDPSFDPEEDCRPPTMRSLWNEIFQNLKRKYEEMIDMPSPGPASYL
jgi:hypothetical protein